MFAKSVESRAAKRRREEAMAVDETVYEYDEVYDKMQAAKQRAKEAKEADSKERKPKYIEGLLTTAATRRLDHLRAEEKMMQREREREGDEFADKDAFVTQAYKDQMAEVRRAEEEERKREEELKKKGGATTGMAHFYRKLLEESETDHSAAVAATQKRTIGPTMPQNLTITKPREADAEAPDPDGDKKPATDVELAQRALQEGKHVELNDDNQIVDKRDLLSAGLNLRGTNTRRLGLQTSSNNPKDGEPVQAHTAVGTAASRKEIEERRRREIQQQLREEEERRTKEREEEERARMARMVAKRNTEQDVMSARERYLARKKQREEAKQDAEGAS
ncbi:coiled-coil domain-containing protein 55-domain containing protein [Schizophyllum fasciatum]